MTIRTYRAATVADALAQVKKDLGPEAVILHTRNYKTGGLLGIGSRPVIEITATGDMRLTPRSPARSAPTPPASSGVASASRAAAVPRPAISRGAPASADTAKPRSVRELAQENRAAAFSSHEVVAKTARIGLSELAGGAALENGLGFSGGAALAALRDEMASVKRMVGRMLHASRACPDAAPLTHDALQACYLKMLEGDVAEEIAGEVAASVCSSLDPTSLQDPGAVREATLRALAAYVPAADDSSFERPKDGRPLTIALVGPTGVGKTTTLAKLAAAHKLRSGLRVALVTSDTYRIAAVEQLRVYANIIGLPLKVALTPAEMAQACESSRDHDVVLIDTAGRAPSDKGRLDELGRFMDAAMPHQVHLVLSSASCPRVMAEAAARFSAVGPSHVIFTKLDEAVSFGVLVNVCRRLSARLSFVTTGQEVPDQIEAGDAMRIAALVLDSRSSPARTGREAAATPPLPRPYAGVGLGVTA